MIFTCIIGATQPIGKDFEDHIKKKKEPLGNDLDLEDDYINSKDKHISTEDQILGEKSNDKK